MDPEEVQVIISELEHQRNILGARAADYARQNYRLMKELKELRDNSAKPNGEDRDPPTMPFAQRLD